MRGLQIEYTTWLTSYSRHLEKMLLEVKVERIFPSVNYVARMVEWISRLSIEKDMVAKLNY